MIVTVMAAISICASPGPQAGHLWKEIKDVRALIDVEDGGGVAAITNSGRLICFDESGKVVSTRTVPEGLEPLSVGADGVRVQSLAPIKGSDEFYVGVNPTAYCQNGVEFHISRGLIIYFRRGVFSRPSFDRWSAVAINKPATKIALLSRVSEIPQIQRFSFLASGEWIQETEVIYPILSGVGIATVAPRFNDLRFVDDENLAFIGGVWTPDSKIDWATKLQAVWPKVKGPYRLEALSRPSTAYLFIVSLKEKAARPLLKLEVAGIGESGGYFAGRISVSANGKWLYLRCVDGLARFSVKGLLAEAGVSSWAW